MYLQAISPESEFAEAAGLYMKTRSIDSVKGTSSKRYIKENTANSYQEYIATLDLYFHGMKLKDIRWMAIKDYQEKRVEGAPPFIRKRRPHEEPGPCPAKPAKSNQETRLLICILRRAGCWSVEDEDNHENMNADENETPRALTEQEQRHWIEVSRMTERWMVVHWYSLLAFDTTMSTNELRGLRIGDINLHQQVVSIPWPASKNRFRHRSIALGNADSLWALERLIDRAQQLGSRDSRHYLFPFYDNRAHLYQPDRHMTVNGIRVLWNEVRDAARLKTFRPYDTRHTAITRLAEQGTPIEIIKARAGHISDEMSRHYTQVSLAAQRQWAQRANQFREPTPMRAPLQMPAQAGPIKGRGRWSAPRESDHVESYPVRQRR